jgi:hypothetical protein
MEGLSVVDGIRISGGRKEERFNWTVVPGDFTAKGRAFSVFSVQ